jgi:hypothetical protein
LDFEERFMTSMRKVCVGGSVIGAIVLGLSATASAQQTVILPDTSQTTTLTANVSEQARVTVPAGVTFNVTNVTASTAATAASVTVQSIVLATATKQLRVSLQASAASFTPPVAGSPTWAAGDVAWNAATWTNATGAAGTLSNSAYTAVATCTPDASVNTRPVVEQSLAAKPTVKRSGSHTLVVTWKFEGI